MLNSQTDCVSFSLNFASFNAPEFKKRSFGKISIKYDIWSFGWLLFHLVTSKNPKSQLDEVKDFDSWVKLKLPEHIPNEIRDLFDK